MTRGLAESFHHFHKRIAFFPVPCPEVQNANGSTISYTSILAQKFIPSFVYFSEKQFPLLRNLILNVK